MKNSIGVLSVSKFYHSAVKAEKGVDFKRIPQRK